MDHMMDHYVICFGQKIISRLESESTAAKCELNHDKLKQNIFNDPMAYSIKYTFHQFSVVWTA